MDSTLINTQGLNSFLQLVSEQLSDKPVTLKMLNQILNNSIIKKPEPAKVPPKKQTKKPTKK